MQVNQFDAPVPGQSLTSTPGSHPFEKPPQFANPNDALEYVWDNITKPRNATHILASLKAGLSVEYLARTILFLGFQSGRWTPDVMLIIGRPVFLMIAKIAQVKGLTDVKLFNPRPEREDMMRELVKAIDSKESSMKTAKPIEAVEEEVDTEEAPKEEIKLGLL